MSWLAMTAPSATEIRATLPMSPCPIAAATDLPSGANATDRLAVLQNIMGTSGLDTVIGTTAFDQNGDVKGGVISSYQVETSWPPKFLGVITQSK